MMPFHFYLLLASLASPGSLGVRVRDIEPMEAASSAIYNLRGAVVQEVVAGGAAQRAGIRESDIIVAVGSETVTGASELVSIMSHHESGETVVVSFFRPGPKLPYPKLSVRVTLGGAPGNVTSARPLPPTTRADRPRTINNVGAIAVTSKQSGQCSVLAPADWTILSGSPAGDAFDVTSGDRRVYAGWAIRGVNRAMQGYYGEAYGDPQASSRVVVGMIGQALGDAGPYNYTGRPYEIGAGFVAQELESGGHKAMIVYRLYPAPMGFPNGSYIISLRIAIAPRDALSSALNTAIGVAASINCSTVFVPPKNGDVPLPRPGDAFDRKRTGETGDLTDYNVQLGSQYAHSPSTGQNYLLDRASQWNDHGPDGPGYYRTVGNTTEKLVPGIQ
jgi:PDZ domain